MEGTYDKKTKKMTMLMKGKDQAGKDTRFKSITTYINAETKRFEFFNLAPGSKDEFVKAMQMDYTKRPDKKRTKKGGR